MDKPKSEPQEIFESLSKYEEEEEEEVHVSGARVVFDKKVYQKKSVTAGRPAQQSDLDELELSDVSLSSVRGNVKEKLTAWAEGKKYRVWMSDILTQQLNIFVRTFPKNVRWIFQVLFFGENKFPFILTLFPVEGVAEETLAYEELKDFSKRTARMLMCSLMNFCHTEFFLLHSALPYVNALDTNKLQEDLERQMSRASEYYGGPAKLSKVAFDQLTQAISFVMQTTAVPCALGLSGRNEDWLLVMDTRWQKLVIHLLNLLERKIRQNEKEPCHLTCEAEKKKKMVITVLEVARRLSFKHSVKVVSKGEILTAVKKLADMERNDRLSIWSSDAPPTTENQCLDVVIVIDSPQPSDLSKVLLTVTSKPSTQTLQDTSLPEEGTLQSEKIRLLLVGETGGGRSATANTLLGKSAFKTGNSFASITRELETHHNVTDGFEIEVTESPGLSAKYPFSRFYSDTQFRTYDAVCYVIKIDRFNKKEKGAFRNFKTVLGENVVKHTIVIFTGGDFQNGMAFSAMNAHQEGHTDNMSETFVPSENLKTVLDECGGRFVVFDNKSEDKDAQRQVFLKALRNMKETLNHEDKTFTCPIMDEEARQPAIA